jgi:hypothetical protein
MSRVIANTLELSPNDNVPVVVGKVSVGVPATAGAVIVTAPEVVPEIVTVFENVILFATLILDAYEASDSIRSTTMVPAIIIP